MNSEIANINEILHNVFDNFSVENSKSASKIVEAWSSVLSKIKSQNPLSSPNEGQNLSDHSRVVDLKNGMLLVEADHPGWISLLQFHKKFILRGLQMTVPEARINSLVFRLKGSQAGISGNPNANSGAEVRAKIEKRIDFEEKNLQNFDLGTQKEQKSYKTDDLAPELARIFEDLKKSMLTNSKE